jgi:hypothetical protein
LGRLRFICKILKKFVGTPSTGLQVLPAVSNKNSMVTESQEVGKNINNSERNGDLMKNTSINELKDLISESKANYKNSKTKFEKFRVLGKLETFLESIGSIDFGGSKNGAKEYFKLAEDYNELMEAVALEETSIMGKDDVTVKAGKTEQGNPEVKVELAEADEEKPLEEATEESKAEAHKLEGEAEEEALKQHKLETESLKVLNKEKILLEHCVIKLNNEVKLYKKCYNGLKNSKDKIIKSLVNESMKTITGKSIQESRERKLKNDLSKIKSIQEKLVNDNVNLINENQQVKKVQAGLYMTAKELAEENLSLQFKKNEENQ